jgi:hypothetical protein
VPQGTWWLWSCPEPRDTWVHMSTHLTLRLNLELACRVPGLQGTNNVGDNVEEMGLIVDVSCIDWMCLVVDTSIC